VRDVYHVSADISILKFPNPRIGTTNFIGDYTGWMGRSWGDGNHNGVVNTAGYPGDKGGDLP
jgi:hypothetical protein